MQLQLNWRMELLAGLVLGRIEVGALGVAVCGDGEDNDDGDEDEDDGG